VRPSPSPTSSDLRRLLVAIAASDRTTAMALLDETPRLATAGLARDDECLPDERRAQIYEGDTALHAAAFSSDAATPSDLARVTTGRGGTGSDAAKAEQRIIVEPLASATR